MTVCTLCGKSIKKYGMGSHMYLAHSEAGLAQTARAQDARRGSMNGPAWNSGLTKETSSSMLKISDSLKGREKSSTTIQKLSDAAKRNKSGGATQGGGRGKKGRYKGFWCDSSWELAYVIFCLENNIEISKCKEVRFYEWQGTQRKYYPDFVVNNIITEIKGYNSKQWEAKSKANPDVRVLFKKDLADVFAYVIGKYGKDYIRLYEPKISEDNS